MSEFEQDIPSDTVDLHTEDTPEQIVEEQSVEQEQHTEVQEQPDVETPVETLVVETSVETPVEQVVETPAETPVEQVVETPVERELTELPEPEVKFEDVYPAQSVVTPTLVFIVPYRDREKHYKLFSSVMKDVLVNSPPYQIWR